MNNGYFRLVNTQKGFGLQIVRAQEGGEDIKGTDVTAYLEREGIAYNVSDLKEALDFGADTIMELGEGPCPAVDERYQMVVDQEAMQAQIRFQAPSPTGRRVAITEVLGDLRVKNIVSGIQMGNLSEHFQSEGCYDRVLIAAQGQQPRQGRDAEIEYLFNTNPNTKPTVREDGSVDYFQLNMISHCKVGDVLARIKPAVPGMYGQDIFGRKIKPRDVKQQNLKFGNNIRLSEDRLSITSLVDGHVMLVDDKVFVSDVYEVANVDLSTGNIDFVGSVQVNGNVKENMRVVAGGNVIVNGVVEGAYIEAKGNIVITRGMNGMSKGVLKAGGNVICKFLENTTVFAEGYVNTESILHSKVSAKTDIQVTGRKGFIVGGLVRAGHLVSVKNLGANMGNATVVEVGADPELKKRYLTLQKEIAETVGEIKKSQPLLISFADKRAKGVQFKPEQIKSIAELDALIKRKSALLVQKNKEIQAVQEALDSMKNARVDVLGKVFMGATIVIDEIPLVLKSEYQYCRFERKDGEVKMSPL